MAWPASWRMPRLPKDPEPTPDPPVEQRRIADDREDEHDDDHGVPAELGPAEQDRQGRQPEHSPAEERQGDREQADDADASAGHAEARPHLRLGENRPDRAGHILAELTDEEDSGCRRDT